MSRAAENQPLPLQLEVTLNGISTDLVAAFSQQPDGRFTTTRAELAELRIDAPGSGTPDERIALDAIPGLTYVYDETEQAIQITIVTGSLARQTYAARDETAPLPLSQTMFGALLNYGLFASIYEDDLSSEDFLDGVTANFEGRVFGEYGTLDTSVLVGTSEFETLRLGTTWSYAFREDLISARAGDVVSGGLTWTRPIRLGGVQVHRNFALRPDLITKPLPTVSGSAAVPSTVDVYVNNVKTYSKDVPSGPFTVTRIPVVSGDGVTRVVVRDASGRETVSETPFYSSPNLLSPGTFDFSVEAGLARLNYGSESDDYGDHPLVVGTARYGWSDRFTVAGHGEIGPDLVNGGVGFVTQVGLLGTALLGASFSTHDGETGTQLVAGFQGEYKDVHFSARTQRTFDRYTDLAAITPDEELVFDPTFSFADVLPPREVDFISLGFPVRGLGGNLNLSYLHRKDFDGDDYDIASVAYSRRLTDSISLNASGFKDFSSDGNTGVYAGLSVALGERRTLSTGLAQDDSGASYSGTYAHAADQSPGSWGWRIRGTADDDTSYQQADVEYYADRMEARASVSHTHGGVSGSAYVDGAVALSSDGIFLSRRINGSFAVVDAGAPDVKVHHENRLVGHTDADGKLLVPGLHAYQKNRITIEPDDLPLNAQIPETLVEAVPADRSGVSITFNVNTNSNAALVEFLDADGEYIESGYTGRVQATGQEFVIGYDGQAYINTLAAENTVEIELQDTSCHATFPFTSSIDTQVLIRGLVCR
ncbi:MAG: fimbria/pilus outer membrane usher protein [Hyphomicrobiaceae bacterium]